MDAELTIYDIEDIWLSQVYGGDGEWKRSLTITTVDGAILDINLTSEKEHVLACLTKGDSCIN